MTFATHGSTSVLRYYTTGDDRFNTKPYSSETLFKVASRVNYEDKTIAPHTSKSLYSFQSQVNNITNLVRLDPEQKVAAELGQRILSTSTTAQDLQTEYSKLQQAMKDISKTVGGWDGSKLRDAGRFSNVVAQLLSRIKDTRMAHQHSIECLILLEVVEDTTHIEMRNTLLSWNRRAREFIRTVRTYASQSMDKRTLNREFLHLEICRMKLWNPTGERDRSHFDHDELSLLNDAQAALETGNKQVVADRLRRIGRHPKCSLFAEASCYILRAVEHRKFGNGSRSWKKDLQSGIALLQDMEEECPALWMRELKQMISIAKDIRTQ